LLVSGKGIENYKKIQCILEKLKILVEEAELWVQKCPQSSEVRRGRGGNHKECVWVQSSGGGVAPEGR